MLVISFSNVFYFGNPFYWLGCSYSEEIFFWQRNQLLRPERDFEEALLDGDDGDHDDNDGNDGNDDDNYSDDVKAVTQYFFPILRKKDIKEKAEQDQRPSGKKQIK